MLRGRVGADFVAYPCNLARAACASLVTRTRCGICASAQAAERRAAAPVGRLDRVFVAPHIRPPPELPTRGGGGIWDVERGQRGVERGLALLVLFLQRREAAVDGVEAH